jgi:hypothetical protein
MTMVAWRATHEERRRAHARIALLAADIHDDRVNLAPRLTGNLFAVASTTSTARYATVLAAGVFVCATIGAIAVLSSRGAGALTSGKLANSSNRAVRANPADSANPESPANPLELIALGHEREDDRLTVRGVVRNPANGSEVARLTAVVLLFSRDGAFLTSGRAAVARPVLGPSTETTFVVTIPDAGDVGRYRVSFRTADRVIPHVDRRNSS